MANILDLGVKFQIRILIFSNIREDLNPNIQLISGAVWAENNLINSPVKLLAAERLHSLHLIITFLLNLHHRAQKIPQFTGIFTTLTIKYHINAVLLVCLSIL